MPKLRSSYICQQCGYISPVYLGKCPECGTWGSLVETIENVLKPSKRVSGIKNISIPKVINLKDVEKRDYTRLSTHLEEFDRVLGGGIVPGEVILIAGDPGIGKSTLLSQLAVTIPHTLYVAGEESAQQIKLRVDRIKKDSELSVLNEIDVDNISTAIQQIKPPLVIIDSIQTLETQDLNSVAGSVGQVRESAHRLQRVAKELQIPIFIVGHVTKEGTVAGPRTLEHVVDAVLQLEGESDTNFRVLRGIKNRFGPTDEVGIFEMEENGMKEIKNPSQMFLDGKINAPGSAVVAIITGLRPMLLEIQALVTKTYSPIPRRIGTGIDNNRLQLLVAVLQKRLKLPLYDQDIFLNVTGGLRITEPGADLAVCMAIISSFKDIPLDPSTVYVGEIGLLGELRGIKQLDKRINEASKLGYNQVISPQNSKTLPDVARNLLLRKS